MHSPQYLLSLFEEKFSSSNFNESPTNLYKPVSHIMSIKGKRIRPLLVLASCDMFGGNVQHALNPAFAVEVFHNFTLVHDDIMDQADVRRGIPTVHKVFGVNAGILAGDVMLAYAYKYLTDVPAQHVSALLSVFNKTAIEIFEGQQMDVDFETRNDVTEQEYLKMIEYKTSVLLGCCLQLGAVLAGAEDANQKALYDFGLNLGLSFQIKDDYLDAFGEAEKVGKRIGGDILQNKKTLLYITCLKNCNTQQQKDFSLLMSESDEQKKIDGVKRLFDITGAKEKVLSISDNFYRASLEALKSVNIAEEKKKVLAAFADKINNRDY